MLTPEQRARLEAEAKRRGIDPADLIAAAEKESGDEKPKDDEPKAAGGDAEPPKLFMYHLPFVKVREVRQRWLGLTESFPGDDEVASKWAAKMAGGAAPAADEPVE